MILLSSDEKNATSKSSLNAMRRKDVRVFGLMVAGDGPFGRLPCA